MAQTGSRDEKNRLLLVPESAGEGAGSGEAAPSHCEGQPAAHVGNPGLSIVEHYLKSISTDMKDGI